MGLHPGLAQWGLTQRDDTFLMQCVPTIQNSTRNRADFFKSCTRLKDLAQLSKGVFIGKQAFFPGFLPCKKVALPHSFSGHHSRASCVEKLRCAAFGTNLRDLWHKLAQALAPRLTNRQAIVHHKCCFSAYQSLTDPYKTSDHRSSLFVSDKELLSQASCF